jgi:hypothetical protein
LLVEVVAVTGVGLVAVLVECYLELLPLQQARIPLPLAVVVLV